MKNQEPFEPVRFIMADRLKELCFTINNFVAEANLDYKVEDVKLQLEFTRNSDMWSTHATILQAIDRELMPATPIKCVWKYDKIENSIEILKIAGISIVLTSKEQ